MRMCLDSGCLAEGAPYMSLRVTLPSSFPFLERGGEPGSARVEPPLQRRDGRGASKLPPICFSFVIQTRMRFCMRKDIMIDCPLLPSPGEGGKGY